MMKRLILLLFALALLLGGVGQAKAGLMGYEVDVSFYYPNRPTLYQDFGKHFVNPTASWTLFGGETTTLTNTQILYYSPPAAGQYQTQPFNGYVYDFLHSGNLITGVTVDPSSTLSGFTSKYVKLTSDGAGGQFVELDLGGGLFFGPDASVVLDVTTSTSAVPEPATLTMLGFGIAGLAGYGWRRRKQAVTA